MMKWFNFEATLEYDINPNRAEPSPSKSSDELKVKVKVMSSAERDINHHRFDN